jgi:sugar/nucleoside kinase (ribokinase family)
VLIRDDADKEPRAVVVGDLMTDVVVRLREHLARDSDTAAQITTSPGGSASNVAVFLARGGVATALVGSVGDDDRGRELVAALVREGVSPQVSVARDDRTGTVVSVVDPEGRRSMLTDRGANLSLDAGRTPDNLFRPRSHLHLSGYELIEEETRPAARAIFERAGAAGMTRSVDCSSAAPLRRMGAAAFCDATKGADVLFANRDEAEVLTGSSDPDAIADALRRIYTTSIVTLGSGGVCLVEQGRRPVVIAPPETAVIDTTGAGDAFTGAFLAAWLLGSGPRASIDAGVNASATIVQNPGARPL